MNTRWDVIGMRIQNQIGACMRGCICLISGLFFGSMSLLCPMATLAQQHIQVEFKARHWAAAMEVRNEAPVKAEAKVKESQQHPGPGHQSGMHILMDVGWDKLRKRLRRSIEPSSCYLQVPKMRHVSKTIYRITNRFHVVQKIRFK